VITFAERSRVWPAATEFQVRQLELEHLDTSYPAVISRITKLVVAFPDTHLVVDAKALGWRGS